MKKNMIPQYFGFKKLFRIMQLSTIFCVLTIAELAASKNAEKEIAAADYQQKYRQASEQLEKLKPKVLNSET